MATTRGVADSSFPNCNPPRKSSPALAVNFSETLFPQRKRYFGDAGAGHCTRRECSFGQGPPQTNSPWASCLWLAPQGTQERAEISKYWLWPQVSGFRKGKEKVWACETRGRTNWKNTVTAANDEADQAAIAAPAPQTSVTMVQTPAAAHLQRPVRLCGDSAELIGQLPPEVSEMSTIAAWLLGYQSRRKLAGPNPGAWHAQPAL